MLFLCLSLLCMITCVLLGLVKFNRLGWAEQQMVILATGLVLMLITTAASFFIMKFIGWV